MHSVWYIVNSLLMAACYPVNIRLVHPEMVRSALELGLTNCDQNTLVSQLFTFTLMSLLRNLTRPAISHSRRILARSSVLKRNVSLYNADVAGLSEEQAEVIVDTNIGQPCIHYSFLSSFGVPSSTLQKGR